MLWAMFGWGTLGSANNVHVTLTGATYLNIVAYKGLWKRYSLRVVASFSRIMPPYLQWSSGIHALTGQGCFGSRRETAIAWPPSDARLSLPSIHVTDMEQACRLESQSGLLICKLVLDR